MCSFQLFFYKLNYTREQNNETNNYKTPSFKLYWWLHDILVVQGGTDNRFRENITQKNKIKNIYKEERDNTMQN